MTTEERERAYPGKQYPYQESEEDLQARLLSGLQNIQRQYRNKKVILVAHGAVIHKILRMMSNQSIVSPQMRLKNACLSTIRFHGELESWIIDDYNQAQHLS